MACELAALLTAACVLCTAGAAVPGELPVQAPVQVPLVRLNDGHDMPAIALGTWLGNNTKGRVDPTSMEDEVERAVRWALAAGYRHVDTAWVYGTEAAVGRALRAAGLPRDQLFITTKLWNDRHARAGVLPALRASLQSLALDYVDLYLVHWPVGQFANQSFDLTDYVETWRGMMDAKRLGLARSIGVSNFNQQQIQRLLDHGLEPPAALQVELNLNLQQPALLAYCRAQGITVQAYTPFGALFPDKARPGAPPPRVDDPELLAIAANHNKTVPQIVLRYLVELGAVPLPKSLTRSRIEQNLAVFDFQLTTAERARLAQYDVAHRTLPADKWRAHPHYPFERE